MTAAETAAAGPRRLDDVIVREIAGEIFLVPIRGRLADLQELFVLNPVGEWIWEHLDGAHPVSALAEGLAATFEVGKEEALADVEAFVGELDEAGLLQPATPRSRRGRLRNDDRARFSRVHGALHGAGRCATACPSRGRST